MFEYLPKYFPINWSLKTLLLVHVILAIAKNQRTAKIACHSESIVAASELSIQNFLTAWDLYHYLLLREIL